MRKIMFSDKHGLTAAVLTGTKTQTRRLIPDKLLSRYGHNKFNDRSTDLISDAPFKVGEVVAVAQSYADLYKTIPLGMNDEDRRNFKWWQSILKSAYKDSAGWSNKMFVKAEEMRYQIEITDIRVERLQDISNEDCLAEGITTKIEGKFEVGNGYGWDTTVERQKRDTFLTPRAAYAALIDKISGKGTWERNPYCFCYAFKLIK
jgi:hypothetical protein